ncbi:MAG: zf-HC2 domain-containing protein [Thermodesulfobacteriota bacterium]
MNCAKVKELLIDYLYGELPEGEKQAFEAHLADCPACAEMTAGLAGVRRLAARRPDPEPSRVTVNRILAFAREEAEKPVPFWRWGWVKVLAPLCVMAVVGGLILYQYRTGDLTGEKLRRLPVVERRAVTTPTAPAEEKTTPTPEEPAAAGPGEAKVEIVPAAPSEEPVAVVPAAPAGPSEPVKTEAAAKAVPVFRGAPETAPEEELEAAAPPAEPAPGAGAGRAETKVSIRLRSAQPQPVTTLKAAPVGEKELDRWLAEPAGDEPKPEAAETKPQAEVAVEPLAAAPDLTVPEKRVTRDLVFDEEKGEAGKPEPEAGAQALVDSAWITAKLLEGQLALNSGEYQRAGEVFLAVLQTLPPGHRDRPKALLLLAQAYEGLGNPEKALETYRLLAQESSEYDDLAHKKMKELTAN